MVLSKLAETLQLEQVKIIELHDAPRLLVEWSSPWREFVSSIGPAFSRSSPRLAGEAPYGIFPYRGMVPSLLLEAFLIFVAIVIPREIQRLRPYAPPKLKPYEVIYYTGDELPRVEDLGGAQSGASGRAGGHEAHHRTQTIHVARGRSMTPRVADAPNIKIPASSGNVANLLAFKVTPATAHLAPPSDEGLRSSIRSPRLADNVIAPAPAKLTRDQSRSGVTLNSVVPPAPNVTSADPRTAPTLSAAVVPPAPSVRSDHTLYLPALDPDIIGPAPNISRAGARTAPSIAANVVGPASTRVSRDQVRSVPALNAGVIPPAPATPGREVAPSRVQMMNSGVVPPPVSAPERDSSRVAKVTLPAPSVIAPPPSADSTHDLRRLESGAAASSPAVIPPPPTQTAGISFVSTIIGKLFGTQDVVPPPPTVSAANNGGSSRGSSNNGLAANVIPPPPAAVGAPTGTASGTSRHASLGTNVIPPPPAASGGASGVGANRNGGGQLLASNVIPPPPSVASASDAYGSGRKGIGLGGPGDVGSALAPPKSTSGTSNNSGVVVSLEPGSNVGLPGNAGKGSVAMSPAGGDKPGLGGSGGGAGIGHSEGPGSGLTGAGPGAGKTGAGPGSDANAHGGISPTPGPGGAGTAATGSPAVPGVDVRGGSSSVVTLPSFNSDSTGLNLPGRSSVKEQQGPAITIVATSRSGGAFDFYGKLPGDNYTVYVDTTIGTVVMQFAEADPSHSPPGPLVGPQGLRTDLPAGLPHARAVVKCRLDASGNLKNFEVLEPGPATMTAKIMAALPSWKFRAATRGGHPIEVNAILGFNIDTNDRY